MDTMRLSQPKKPSTFSSRAYRSPGEILSYLNDALKKTRGAVAGIAGDDTSDGQSTYAAVGNTSASVVSRDSSRSLVAHSGTLGVASPRVQEFRMDWPDDGVLIMHSDGLQSRWDLASYSGLIARHPAVIGAALLRDFRRQRDDASVVVVSRRLMNSLSILKILLRTEQDVVQAGQRAREVAARLGFDNQDQIRLATATSEVARNAFRYARGGEVTFCVNLDLPQRLEISAVVDSGPGIANLEEIMAGRYRSETGLGMGILGTRRLMDGFDITTGANGTTASLVKYLPRHRQNCFRVAP